MSRVFKQVLAGPYAGNGVSVVRLDNGGDFAIQAAPERGGDIIKLMNPTGREHRRAH